MSLKICCVNKAELQVQELPYGRYFVDHNGHLCLKINLRNSGKGSTVVVLGEMPDRDTNDGVFPSFPWIESKGANYICKEIVEVELHVVK